MNTDNFYVVLLVKDRDRDCLVHKGDINPFKREDDNGEEHVATKYHFSNLVEKSCKYFTFIFICKFVDSHYNMVGIMEFLFTSSFIGIRHGSSLKPGSYFVIFLKLICLTPGRRQVVCSIICCKFLSMLMQK